MREPDYVYSHNERGLKLQSIHLDKCVFGLHSIADYLGISRTLLIKLRNNIPVHKTILNNVSTCYSYKTDLHKYIGDSFEFTGSRLRNKRLAMCLKSVDLAKILDVSSMTISKWENGDSVPIYGHIQELKRVMELITRKEKNNANS